MHGVEESEGTQDVLGKEGTRTSGRAQRRKAGWTEAESSPHTLVTPRVYWAYIICTSNRTSKPASASPCSWRTSFGQEKAANRELYWRGEEPFVPSRGHLMGHGLTFALRFRGHPRCVVGKPRWADPTGVRRGRRVLGSRRHDDNATVAQSIDAGIRPSGCDAARCSLHAAWLLELVDAPSGAIRASRDDSRHGASETCQISYLVHETCTADLVATWPTAPAESCSVIINILQRGNKGILVPCDLPRWKKLAIPRHPYQPQPRPKSKGRLPHEVRHHYRRTGNYRDRLRRSPNPQIRPQVLDCSPHLHVRIPRRC